MTRALLGSGAASDALHSGAQYRVRVRAEAAEETSAWSEVRTARTSTCTPAPASAPAPHVLYLYATDMLFSCELFTCTVQVLHSHFSVFAFVVLYCISSSA